MKIHKILQHGWISHEERPLTNPEFMGDWAMESPSSIRYFSCNKFQILDLFLQENWGRIHYKFWLFWHRPVSCLFRVFFQCFFAKGFGLSYLGDTSVALPSGTFGQHPKKQFQAAQWPTQKQSVKGSLAHPSPSEMLLGDDCLFCGIEAWLENPACLEQWTTTVIYIYTYIYINICIRTNS